MDILVKVCVMRLGRGIVSGCCVKQGAADSMIAHSEGGGGGSLHGLDASPH